MYVAPGTGAILHKSRPSHGFAINDSNAVKKIFFSDGTVLNWRPNELCYLPKHSTYKVVTQIAELCNYSNIHFFSRQFKECMGITPTQFMKKYISSK